MQRQLLKILQYLKSFLARILKRYDGNLPYIITSVIAVIIVIFGIKVFLELTDALKTTYLKNFDTQVSDYVQGFRSDPLTTYFTFVTDLGDVTGYIIVFSICTILFYFVFKSWKYVAQLGLVMILALSSNILLKQVINRARPSVEHLVTVKTLSYPSGHAMISMAFYGLLIYLVAQFNMSKIYKVLIISLLIVLILSIGVSRIYLGVHYPSDIVGGFIAGFIWVVFCIMIFNLIKIFRSDPRT
ncbi:phosphatase PAP2 family protein [Dokdonia sp. Hel_I_53]|uniref:phosphatase PAP2 family protein n=1 Tax=Dokdonia sp. Hel_I_53 TaxID=1566287 RepID=UPI00119A019B|nr:phosphatase PAP2 family protein [Dokdonia sp. Hel_I_53]TVZ51401.1 undecaprenyl-diphosphatase [Dokdonia sp. Hel_I_53]